MKVVLFCGGQGMRLREHHRNVPKPLVPIGDKPILWHIMKYYAHHGHTEFILCLGHKGNAIKEYFLNYNEALSNDFVLSHGGNDVQLLSTDIEDWKITFVNTGLDACVGERLMAVRDYVCEDEVFLANYADGLSDVDINAVIRYANECQSIACFVAVEPNGTFHVVESDDAGSVSKIGNVATSGMRINGGFFVLRREVFDYMRSGDELVEEPFRRLISAGRLFSYNHNGFWACMDTFKEKQQLEDLFLAGNPPWMVWDRGRIRSLKRINPRVAGGLT